MVMLVHTLPEQNNVCCAIMQAEFQMYVVHRVGYVGTDSCPLASLICDQQDSVLLFCYLQQRTVV